VVSFGHGQNPVFGRGLIGSWIFFDAGHFHLGELLDVEQDTAKLSGC